MKKICSLILIVLTFFVLPSLVSASDEVINVYIFKSSTCPHCEQALEFFGNLKNDSEYGSYFNLVEFETYKTVENAEEVNRNVELAEKVSKYFGQSFEGVPLIVIGDKHFDGYASSMDDDIINTIITTYHGDVKDVVAGIQNGTLKPSYFDAIMTGIIIVVFVVGIGYFVYAARKNVTEE